MFQINKLFLRLPVLLQISYSISESVKLRYLSNNSVIMEHNTLGVFNFSQLHNTSDSCWIVARDVTNKDNMVNIATSDCKEEQDGWVILNGNMFHMNFIDKNHQMAHLEAFVDYINEQNTKTPKELLKQVFLSNPMHSDDNSSNFQHSLFHIRLRKAGRFQEVLLAQAKDNKPRMFNFLKGEYEFVVVIPTAVAHGTPVTGGLPKHKSLLFYSGRHKRQISKKYMELAVFADQAVYDFFATRYSGTSAQVQKKITDFVNAVLDSVQIFFQLSSLRPNIYFKIATIEVWTKQPPAVPVQLNAEKYLSDFCNFIKPRTSSYDHATLFTGLNLKHPKLSTAFGGLAYMATACTDASCSLVKPVNNGFIAAYLLAHEIGHVLGIRHDGDPSNPTSATCDDKCCLMAPIPTKPLWSPCSSSQLQAFIRALDAGSHNCLDNPGVTDPIGSPGQDFPNEAQCHEVAGDCSRYPPGYESDCANLRCQSGLLIKSFPYPRSDGSYCSAAIGGNKVCAAGHCVDSTVLLKPVHGGWGQWDCDPHERCGGSCSLCEIIGQVQVVIEVRRCDSPYPNNGGKTCRGSSVRSQLCSNSACTTGSADVHEYVETMCKESVPGSISRMVSECMYSCDQKGVSISFVRIPAGTPCGGGSGKCVQDTCMTTQCSDASYYVTSSNECANLCTTPSPVTRCGNTYMEILEDHFYTTNLDDVFSAVSHGYTLESTVGKVAATDAESGCSKDCNKKIYRLFHTQKHDHFYTVNETKLEDAQQHGYIFDGPSNQPSDEGYCIMEKACGATLPLYQFYSSAMQDHFYTSDENEKNKLINNPLYGYIYEGIECYIFP